ncbi:tRNA (adenosine(37)-N6)-dimethylallyltransferase MiaA [Algoriphagus sp. AGSA1]|uniref:tRNA (adenosine(37)-N6)-dimethylallyltransferase MiaA n=1 Tax=Algoriphagus sp. AGSA1 TaxID=2907213 RepID=UPI001F014EFB|nr:tRNA (adenosine(37)-N6)-dimethylallyltransferase MiaA [Algoriphagus sp. AGSA1]MCE7053529.1 tRNA (adenosine(37)-N6)-dimethylallyltransferase MiaA [Algoriphagus sp. AGSA1]
MSHQSYLILVVGPTAVGKTNLCLNLAKNYKTEIVSCDSRQFYREMNLGTAKPTAEELNQVPHHFVDSLSIEEEYDVRRFEQDAIALLENLFAKHQVVVMTGGSGLFADAVVNGLDEMPTVPAEVRRQLIQEYEEKGIAFLQEEVAAHDPEYYSHVDQKNPQRLMRALEIWRGTGEKFSSFRVKSKKNRFFKVIKIGLEREREELYTRIDLRMDRMIAAGLFDEASGLYDRRHLNALQTVGYSEIFGFMDGKYDKEEAVRLLKRNSRRYAKRQMTWFKKDESVRWFSPEMKDQIIAYIESQIG